MSLINLTPHDISILNSENIVARTIKKKEGIKIPRLKERIISSGSVEGIPIKNKIFLECENLPSPQKGIYYIVPFLIASAVKRKDLLVPNTVCNELGEIIGCRSFAQIL